VTGRPLWLVLCAMCVVCAQAFLRKSAVSRLLIKLTGSDQNPESLAPVLLARYDIDGNKVLDKVLGRCSTQSPTQAHGGAKEGHFLAVVASALACIEFLCVWAIRTGARAWTAEKAHSPDRALSLCQQCLFCPAQSERADLIDELTRCVREPFFVFVVSNAFQPGDYLSGVAVLELERPLAVKEVVVGLRCHGRVRARACGQTTAGPSQPAFTPADPRPCVSFRGLAHAATLPSPLMPCPSASPCPPSPSPFPASLQPPPRNMLFSQMPSLTCCCCGCCCCSCCPCLCRWPSQCPRWRWCMGEAPPTHS
jgi:hypothetical protein